MSKLRMWPVVGLVIIASMVLVACGPATPQVVEKEVVVEKEKPVTVVVEKEVPVEKKVVETVVVEVTPTPEPTPKREEPRYGGTLTIAFPVEPAGFDPATSWAVPDWQSIRGVLFNTLYTWDLDTNLIPDLAADFPTVSADGLVYTVPLKKGVKFCNGREMVAADVKYSLERACWPETEGWGGPFLAVVEGVQEVLNGTTKEISGITIVDDYTLQFRLTQPLYNFVMKTGMTNFGIVPREEAEKWGKEFGRHPMGTGPFCLTEWIPEEKTVFTKNPYYGEWKDGKPYINELVYTYGATRELAALQFERGDIDIIGPPEAGQSPLPAGELPRYMKDPRYFSEGGLMLNAIDIQGVKPPLDNKLVRQAMSYAVDREAFVRIVESGRGLPAVGIWTPKDPAFRQGRGPLPYDPEKAKALLAQAGYPDGFTVTFTWAGESWPGGEKFGSLLKEQFAAVGITLELEDVAAGVLSERMRTPGGLELSLFGWSPDYPDPFDMYSWAFSCTGVEAKTNRRFWCDPEIEKMVYEAERITDNQKRLERYWEIEDRLLDQMIVVPIYYPVWDTVVNPRVGGFRFHPLFVFWPEEYWIIE